MAVVESRARALGHPLHPILVVFPLGLFSTATIFDALHRLRGQDPKLAEHADAMIASGLIGGAAAAIPGLIDWVAIPKQTRARSVGAIHGLGNAAVLGLFGASWLLRRKAPHRPGTAAITLSLLGTGLAMYTGWLGGELVHRLGVSIDEGADLNAPNSLVAHPDGPGITIDPTDPTGKNDEK